MPKKVLAWIAIAFLAFYVITNPVQSASAARSIGSGVAAFATALAGGGR